MSNKFWYNWLIATTLGVMIFSLILVFLPHEMQALLNETYLANEKPDQIFTAEANHFIHFVYGVLGGVMLGWMMAVLYSLVTLFGQGKREGWNIIAFSLMTWFVFDTGASLATGFWQNAVLNAGFAVLFVIPLAATYREFHEN